MTHARKNVKTETLSRKVRAPVKKSKVRLAIECTPEERKYIKMYASYADKTLNEFVMDCVRTKVAMCKQSHVPNKKTASALDATQRGEGITMFHSIEDFFKSMEK